MNIFVTFYDDLGRYDESTAVDSIAELISPLGIMKSTGGYNSYTINCEVGNVEYK